MNNFEYSLIFFLIVTIDQTHEPFFFFVLENNGGQSDNQRVQLNWIGSKCGLLDLRHHPHICTGYQRPLNRKGRRDFEVSDPAS